MSYFSEEGRETLKRLREDVDLRLINEKNYEDMKCVILEEAKKRRTKSVPLLERLETPTKQSPSSLPSPLRQSPSALPSPSTQSPSTLPSPAVAAVGNLFARRAESAAPAISLATTSWSAGSPSNSSVSPSSSGSSSNSSVSSSSAGSSSSSSVSSSSTRSPNKANRTPLGHSFSVSAPLHSCTPT